MDLGPGSGHKQPELLRQDQGNPASLAVPLVPEPQDVGDRLEDRVHAIDVSFARPEGLQKIGRWPVGDDRPPSFPLSPSKCLEPTLFHRRPWQNPCPATSQPVPYRTGSPVLLEHLRPAMTGKDSLKFSRRGMPSSHLSFSSGRNGKRSMEKGQMRAAIAQHFAYQKPPHQRWQRLLHGLAEEHASPLSLGHTVFRVHPDPELTRRRQLPLARRDTSGRRRSPSHRDGPSRNRQ